MNLEICFQIMSDKHDNMKKTVNCSKNHESYVQRELKSRLSPIDYKRCALIQ